MASTGYINNGSYLTASGSLVRGHTNLNYNVSRTNNIVYFYGCSLNAGLIRESGSITYIVYSGNWTNGFDVPSGTNRGSRVLGSGTYNLPYYSSAGGISDFSFAVGAYDTGVYGRSWGTALGDPVTVSGNVWIPIPALGDPYLASQSASGVGVREATVNYSAVAGANATFTSIKIGYGLADGSYPNEISSASASGAFNLTSLIPATTYHYRFIITNGGGKSAITGDYTFTTLPAPSTSQALLGIIGVL